MIRGEVGGAVRGVARTVVVEETGTIGDDLAVAAVTTRVHGSVGRDAIIFGGRFELTGSIGRDLHGRFVRGALDGAIARNVDISTSSLDVGPNTDVCGSLLYRSNRSADRDPAAVIGGQFSRLSPRPSFFVDVWWTMANILGLLAFLFTGIVVLWLLRDTSTRAVSAIVNRPWRTLGLGLGALILIPVVIATFVVTLVGVPVAVLLALLYLLGFFLGPIPAVAAVGVRLRRGRGSVFGAFVIGALAWRAGIFLLSFVAGALYVLALVWGIGAWASAVWDGRAAAYRGGDPTTTTART